ncbi:MAG: choice-of-anchor tandem repeat NxxGxxAF-containing protein [Blastocatellia bacterium]
MFSRRFPLTLGLLAALSAAGAGQLQAQPTGSQANPPKVATQDDGPVAVTARTNTRTAPATEESKPVVKNMFGNFGMPMLNSKGDLAFLARFVGGQGGTNFESGAFIYKTDNSWEYTRDGDKGANFKSPISSIHQITMSENGDLVFTATIDEMAKPYAVSGTVAPTTVNVKQTGLFIKNAEGIKLIYQMGQEIPDNPATYIGFSNASINSKGTLAFIGTYTDPDGRGLFIQDKGKLTLVARSGQKTPAGPDTQYSEHFYPTPINERGELAFFCRVSGGGGIFRYGPKGMEAIAIQEKPSPIAGSNYIGFGNRTPGISNSGGVVFVGFTDGEKAGRLLFYKGDGPTEVVVRSGDTVPDSAATFTDFNMPAVNAKGEIVFVGNFAGRGRGVFLKTAAGIEPIALYEKLVPGLDPKVETNIFNNFLTPVINDKGDVAFMAQIKNAAVGIFLKRKGEPLKMVAHTGDPAPFK